MRAQLRKQKKLRGLFIKKGKGVELTKAEKSFFDRQYPRYLNEKPHPLGDEYERR